MRHPFLCTLLCATSIFAGVPAFCAEPVWTEVRSPHFNVVTDGGDKRGREVALRFEQMRALFAKIILKDKVNIPVPLQIIAFRNAKELKQVSPLWKGKPVELSGLFQMGEDRNFIALDLSAENGWTTVFHEYAHTLLNANYPRTQPWFDEGFAEYYSTIKVDKKEASIGTAPDYAFDLLSQGRWFPVDQLFSVPQESREYNENGERRNMFYGQSWMVFHFIVDKHRLKETSHYFDLVMNHKVPVADAIRQAFGMEPKQFDKELHDYFSGNRITTYKTPPPEGIEENIFVARKMKDFEADTVIADMHAHSADYQERAIQEYQSVLQRFPQSAAAERGIGYVHLHHGDLDTAGQYFKRAADLGSDDPRVYYFYALFLQKKWATSGQDPEVLVEINQATEKSLSLDPTFPDSYYVKAFALSQARDHEQAVKLLRNAIALAPREDRYRLTLAQELSSLKKYDDALIILGQLKTSPDAGIANIAAQQEKTIAEWKEKPILQILADQKEVEAPQWRKKNDSGDKEELETLEEAQSGQATKADTRPMRYVKGLLTRVECAPPAASLHITAGGKKYTLMVSDTAHAVLIGVDQFSCAWKNKHVSVNYREGAGTIGNVVSLEVQ